MTIKDKKKNISIFLCVSQMLFAAFAFACNHDSIKEVPKNKNIQDV